MKKFIRLLSLLFICFFLPEAYSKVSEKKEIVDILYNFEKILNKDKKRESTFFVKATSDTNDVLWVASADGALSYNGASTTNHPRFSNELNSNYVGSIVTLEDNTVLFGTISGLIKKDFSNNTTSILDHKPGHPETLPYKERVSAMHYEKRLNKVVVGMENHIAFLDLSTNVFTPLKLNTELPMKKQITFWSFHVRGDYLWAGSYSGGLFKIDMITGKMQTFHSDSKGSPFSVVKSLVASPWNDDEFYFSSYDGLFIVNTTNNSIRAHENHSLNHQRINTVTSDNNGGLWVAGDNLYHINKYKKVNTYNKQAQFGLLDDERIEQVHVDSQNTVYVFINKAGIFKASPSTSVILSATPFRAIDKRIKRIYSTSDDRIFYSGTSGLSVSTYVSGSLESRKIYKEDPNKKFGNIKRIHEGINGDILIVEKQELTVISKEYKTISYNIVKMLGGKNHIRDVFQDYKGRIWVLMFRGGLYKLDTIQRKLVNIELTPKVDFASNPILSLIVSPDRSKALISIISKAGLIDLETGNVTLLPNIPKLQGRNSVRAWGAFSFISNDSVYLAYGSNYVSRFKWSCLCQELIDIPTTQSIVSAYSRDNVYYFFTKGGDVIYWESDTNFIRTLSDIDGLPHKGISLYNIAINKDKSAFFGSEQGLSYISKNLFSNTQPKSITLISELLVNNLPQLGAIEKEAHFTLKYDENDINIRFKSNITSSQKNISYKYRLEGYKSNWTSVLPSNEPSAVFTNLHNGDYTFQVKSSNNNNEWGDVTEVKFTITPALWNTWYAYLIYIIMAFFLLREIIRYKTRVVDARAEFAEKKVIERTKELSEMTEQLAATNERDRKTVMRITHALRTPLSILSGTLAKIHSKTNDFNNELNLADTQVTDMLRTIDLLLTRAKFEKNHEIELHKVNFSRFISDILKSFAPFVEQKGLAIEVYVTPDVGVEADPFSIGEVVLNLLSNAVKYTQKGKIIISLSASNSKLVLKVQDTGIGISEDNLHKITKEWGTVLRNDALPNTYSSGLGMAAVNEIVNSLNGDLSINSKLNVGTTITITLPSIDGVEDSYVACVADYYIQRELSHTESSIESQQLSEEVYRIPEKLDADTDNEIVLVVEDSPVLAQQISDSLREFYTVLVAENGIKALAIMKDYHPSIVVSDIMMPEMDGLELAAEIKSDPSLAYIPIILLTANTEEHSKLSALGLGVNDYLNKPVKFEELYLRIRNLFGQNKLVRETLASNPYNKKVITLPENEEAILSSEGVTLRDDLIDFMERTFPEDPTVEMASVEFGYPSSNSYGKKFKRNVDITARKFIADYKLEKALPLLANTTDTILTVAVDCGFSSSALFSNNFKAKYKMTPKQYRENNSPNTKK